MIYLRNINNYFTTAVIKDDSINSTFKIIVMKYTLIITVLTLLATSPMSAQMDDVYYNPDEVVKTKNTTSSSNRLGSYSYNDYDFYYTSRIRRFHRPLQVFNFNNFNRWNSFGMYDPFYSSWNSPFSRFGSGMSMSSFGWVGSPFMYMPSYNYMPTWGNGYGYNNWGQSNNNNNTTVTPVDASNGYYGPRRGGGSVGPVPGARNPEVGTIESTPRTNPSAGRNMPMERSTRIPSVEGSGAGRYPTTEGRIPSTGGYSPRTSEPSVEYSRQRPSTTVQPRTSSEIRSAERINSTTRSASPSRTFDSPSSSSSWSTPRSSSVGSGSSSSPSSSSSAPSSSGRSTSSGGRVINQ